MELVPAEKIENCECEPIDFGAENPKSLFTLGYELGREAFKRKGLGLAAPQVGIFRKIMVFQDNDGLMMIAMNPQYIPTGSRTKIVESCLSYPDEDYVVKRYKTIKANFWTFDDNKKLKKMSINLRGNVAVVFQHETDHLNGVTIAMKGKKIADDKTRE